ncbi:MAG: type II secretion system protein [Candidatus Veblenbacteria bacterium]|nr:type II secretion system protein [Candidatus Veblenbacteria bacterium]
MVTSTKTKAHQGFTLIELLVVISIIGLLSTLAVVALNNARIRSRDAKRLSDMSAVSTGMQLYLDGTGAFSGACKSSTGAVLPNGTQLSACVGNGGTTGIDDFLPGIAQIKDPTGTSACANPATGLCNYTLNALTATTFTINFYQEGGDAGGVVNERGLIE